MKTALRLASLATILTLAPAAFAGAESPLSDVLDASTIAADPATFAPPAAPASVPEPAAIAPIAGAIIVALRRRRAVSDD